MMLSQRIRQRETCNNGARGRGRAIYPQYSGGGQKYMYKRAERRVRGGEEGVTYCGKS